MKNDTCWHQGAESGNIGGYPPARQAGAESAFFHSIIITGGLFLPEASYGGASGNIMEGGFCLNANPRKN
jgi:hypothetical protein